jgi:alkylation response protein AidB-like acyl-CoA dehydrogenase
MIGFQLSEEQEEMRKKARQFAQAEIRPVAAHYDEREQAPWPILERAARIGLTTYRYPEKYGGGGVESLLTACLITEELSWGCSGIANTILGCDTVAVPILLTGTEAQKDRFIPPFCDRDKVRLGAFALTEAEAGSDVTAVRANAKRDGDVYILNGRKQYITFGSIAALYITKGCTLENPGRSNRKAERVSG